MRSLFALFTILFCVTLHAKPSRAPFKDPILEEIRIDLEDLKHELKTTQVDLNLLDEQIKKQKKIAPPLDHQGKIDTIEKKILKMESRIDAIVSDLHTLSQQSAQILNQIQAHEHRLNEVVKLKSTLTSLSKALGTPTSSPQKIHRVVAGDSLEKIARTYHIPVATLKKINQLTTDKIFIGQELKVE